jgi:glycosyltransferase involved in cell wall biosynthesis
MPAVRVAFDAGPLVGHRTGVGNAVAALRDVLSARDDVELVDYIVSGRAHPSMGHKLPVPALIAHRLWTRGHVPRADRWLPPFDVIHGTNYVVPPSRKPRIVSVYDCWFLDAPHLASPTVRRAGQLMLRAVREGATVHSCSSATADALRAHAADASIHVIALGALPLPAAPGEPPLPDLAGRDFVLSLGTLERRKNVPILVEAFALLADSVTDVLLVIAGNDGDDRAAINGAIDRHPEVAQRIVLTGRIDDATRCWLARHAAVFAYPSLDEGFGFPLLDSMQAEVPIVASDRGSIPEVVGDAALLCPADDPQALAHALHDALTDDAMRRLLIERGTSRWPHFSWERTGSELAAVYAQLAETA